MTGRSYAAGAQHVDGSGFNESVHNLKIGPSRIIADHRGRSRTGAYITGRPERRQPSYGTERARPTSTRIAPLFLVHALRYLPSSAFAPGQVGPTVPMHAMETIAYGDLGSAALAIVAALFPYYRWRGALAVAWLVNIIASLDWINGAYVAASNKLVTYPMGGNWYIINYYVPVIGVIHLMIFARLLRARTR